MGKISLEFETAYEKGDVVVFEKHDILEIGIILGYYVDQSAGGSIWYDVAVNKKKVYTYMNEGDVPEYDILGKVNDVALCDAIREFFK